MTLNKELECGNIQEHNEKQGNIELKSKLCNISMDLKNHDPPLSALDYINISRDLKNYLKNIIKRI